jgi:hypothetical protein
LDIDQTNGGPPCGQLLRKFVSRDTPSLAGPRNWGQSSARATKHVRRTKAAWSEIESSFIGSLFRLQEFDPTERSTLMYGMDRINQNTPGIASALVTAVSDCPLSRFLMGNLNLTDRPKILDRLSPPTRVFSSPEGFDDRF